MKLTLIQAKSESIPLKIRLSFSGKLNYHMMMSNQNSHSTILIKNELFEEMVSP